MEIITSHMNADFDAFASMLAAKKLYPNAELVFPGSQEKKLRDFFEAFQPAKYLRIKDVDIKDITRLVCVDVKSPERLGPLRAALANPSVDVHIYDHHVHEETDIHGSLEVLDTVGAASTIMTELLKERGRAPEPMEATILCMGIYEETGNLLFPTTTERDVQAVAYLMHCGASLNIVSSYLKTELNVDELDALGELAHGATEILTGGPRVLLARASSEKYLGDAAHLAHRLMDLRGTDAVIIMLRMEGKVVVVARSRAPELNVAEVMEALGGGGHPTAASATVKDMPLDLLQEQIIEIIHAVVKPGKFAIDVMTRPVITVDEQSTMAEAEAVMTRHGINVLPVSRGKLYLGLISRENVEKAIFHGFQQASVMDFASTDDVAAERYTPIRDIRAVMIEQNQRFMPVVENGEIIGAITRTDLLRAMYEDYLRRSGIKEPFVEERPSLRKNLKAFMKNRFPTEIYDLLEQAGRTAEAMGYQAYLVGGSVRDMLRGEENLDMDIVIEGDGILFAQEFAKHLHGRVHPHERFGTAKLVTDTMRLDIATSRDEYYESPASLPKVQMSSIKRDLYRRDFTINTLAVKLNPDDMGRLVDFFGGQQDLKEKTIRVLHNLSFVEDPTRAFRAFRFAQRFGFRLSKHTENLIKSALKMKLFDRLTGSRLHEEFELIFEEKDPVPVIRQMADIGLIEVIHPELNLTERLEAILDSTYDVLQWFDLLFTEERPEKANIYLMALLCELKEEEVNAAFTRLMVPEKVSENLIRDMRFAEEARKKLPAIDPAVIYDALAPLHLEALLFAMATTVNDEKKKEISHFLLELRKVRPLLGGDDLKRLGVEPGPVYAEILSRLLHERLRGNLRSRDDEEQYVKEHCMRHPHAT